jgi:hypothetical protein
MRFVGQRFVVLRTKGKNESVLYSSLIKPCRQAAGIPETPPAIKKPTMPLTSPTKKRKLKLQKKPAGMLQLAQEALQHAVGVMNEEASIMRGIKGWEVNQDMKDLLECKAPKSIQQWKQALVRGFIKPPGCEVKGHVGSSSTNEANNKCCISLQDATALYQSTRNKNQLPRRKAQTVPKLPNFICV